MSHPRAAASATKSSSLSSSSMSMTTSPESPVLIATEFQAGRAAPPALCQFRGCVDLLPPAPFFAAASHWMSTENATSPCAPYSSTAAAAALMLGTGYRRTAERQRRVMNQKYADPDGWAQHLASMRRLYLRKKQAREEAASAAESE
eukprot:scaffold83541_cov25-Prasinocladus_malaysianus.AAC.3